MKGRIEVIQSALFLFGAVPDNALMCYRMQHEKQQFTEYFVAGTIPMWVERFLEHK